MTLVSKVYIIIISQIRDIQYRKWFDLPKLVYLFQYEFKAKGVKKRKVTVDVSTDGVRVTTRIKKNGKVSPYFTFVVFSMYLNTPYRKHLALLIIICSGYIVTSILQINSIYILGCIRYSRKYLFHKNPINKHTRLQRPFYSWNSDKIYIAAPNSIPSYIENADKLHVRFYSTHLDLKSFEHFNLECNEDLHVALAGND